MADILESMPRRKTAPKQRSAKPRPNRISHLSKLRKLTYADIAERVRTIAKRNKDAKRMKVHEVTINRLATGTMKLSQDWMTILAEVLAVSPSEIIASAGTENLRRVRVVLSVEGNRWRNVSESEIPDAEQFDIMIPNDESLASAHLYAGEVRGADTNMRYPAGAVMVFSRIEQAPGEIVVGKRYHVRATRDDGKVEDTIRLLVQDKAGDYWLRPESDQPQHQAWMPLKGTGELQIEIVGRVRGVFFRED